MTKFFVILFLFKKGEGGPWTPLTEIWNGAPGNHRILYTKNIFIFSWYALHDSPRQAFGLAFGSLLLIIYRTKWSLAGAPFQISVRGVHGPPPFWREMKWRKISIKDLFRWSDHKFKKYGNFQKFQYFGEFPQIIDNLDNNYLLLPW